jgi:hypothetical protein
MNPDELPLRDIHLPDPLSWWQPAIGWWLLVGASILLIAGISWWLRRRAALRRAPATLARHELDRVRTEWLEHGDATHLVGDLSVWLRRTGMSFTRRAQAASLTGQAWRRFLDELAGETVFNDVSGALIISAPYRSPVITPVEDRDAKQLLDVCERWLHAAAKHQSGSRA